MDGKLGKRLAVRIKELRVKNELSQEQVARALGISCEFRQLRPAFSVNFDQPFRPTSATVANQPGALWATI